MIKYIILVTNIILFLIITPIFSQTYSSTESDNEVKYWIWRDRLVNDFMVPGNGVGCGIIMTQRGQYPLLNDYTGGFAINDEGWPQGYYLAVLATEWKLLHDVGQSTTKTEEELYYALKTLDRLDISAENYWAEYWGNGQDYPYLNIDYNGFMIRDDIFDESNPFGDAVYITPPDYTSYTDDYGMNSYDKFMHLNSDNGTAGKYVKQSILPRYTDGTIINLNDWATKTKTIGNQNFPNGYRPGAAASGIHTSYDMGMGWLTGPEESSQDHYSGMMIGLCTIIKCLPDNYIFHAFDDCSKEENFNKHAKNILSRIIHFMQNSWSLYYQDNDDNPHKQQCELSTVINSPLLGSLENAALHCWMATNPVTGMGIKGDFWPQYISSLWSGDFDLDCECISGGAAIVALAPAYATVYNTWVKPTIDVSFPNDIDASCGLGLHYDNRSYSPTLFTLSNLGAHAFVGVYGAKIENNSDAVYLIDCNQNQRDKSEYEFLDLLYCFLNGGTPERSLNNVYPHDWQGYYDNFLNDFPYLNNCGPIDIVDIPYHEVNFDNMLPEMLTHNLLKLLKGHSYLFPQYSNFEDINDYPYNSDNEIVGTGSDATCSNLWTKTQINSFNTIESSAKIGNYTDNNCTWTGYVQYVAAKKITLKPGFKVSNGAFFSATIDNEDQLIDASGDYSWMLNECEPCSYPPLVEVQEKVSQNCPCPYLSTNCIATFSASLDQPYDCYHDLSGGLFKWTLTDPNGNNSLPVTSNGSYIFYPSGGGNSVCFNDGCTYFLKVQYYQGLNMLSEKNIEIDVHPFAHPGFPCNEAKTNDSDSSNSNQNATNNNLSEILIYPNPTDGVFTVSCTNIDETYSVEVSNELGETVFSTYNAKNSTQIDLSSQAKGIYFVKTVILEKTISETKIIYQ